jgi:hypothetical protein
MTISPLGSIVAMHCPAAGLTGAQAETQEAGVSSTQQLQSEAAFAPGLAQKVNAANIAIVVFMGFSTSAHCNFSGAGRKFKCRKLLELDRSFRAC